MYVKGNLQVASDKSISHRSIMLASLAKGKSEIYNFLYSNDCIATLNCFKKLGIEIEEQQNKILINSKGLYSLTSKEHEILLDCKNSGTTLRLLAGILTAQNFSSKLIGDDSLSKRPMDRIVIPLKLMGANIKSNNGFSPLIINKSSKISGISYTMPIASAQVKSAILLASLYADSTTRIVETESSRNHTELMLKSFNANIDIKQNEIILKPKSFLEANKIEIPGDFSSAAFFITLTLLLKNSHLLIKKVGINPTRTGFLEVLNTMGANIEIIKKYSNTQCEEYADLSIKYSQLKAFTISGNLIPRLIDEIPILCILALFSDGTTYISDAKELKIKESNRLHILVTELSKLGFNIKENDDGMIIKGNERKKININSISLNSHNDHRLFMSFYILSLILNENIKIEGKDSINISYPNFFEDLKSILK